MELEEETEGVFLYIVARSSTSLRRGSRQLTSGGNSATLEKTNSMHRQSFEVRLIVVLLLTVVALALFWAWQSSQFIPQVS